MSDTPAQAWTDDNAIINRWRKVFGEYPDVGQLAFVRTMRDDLAAEHERLQLELIAQLAAEDKRAYKATGAIIARLQQQLAQQERDLDTASQCVNELEAELAALRLERIGWNHAIDTQDEYISSLEAELAAVQRRRYVPVSDGEIEEYEGAYFGDALSIVEGHLEVFDRSYPFDARTVQVILPDGYALCRLQPAQDAPQEAHSDGTND